LRPPRRRVRAPFRRQLRGPEQEHVLVHIDGYALGQSEDGLHHPLVEEADGEPGILGLHSKPAIELIELESHFRRPEGIRDVVEHVSGGDSQTGGREPKRHHCTGEPSSHRAPLTWILVPEVERPNVLTPAPIPDEVLGPVPLTPEHRERQPCGVGEQVERTELQAGLAAQDHQAPLSVAAGTPTPPDTGERGHRHDQDEPPHQRSLGCFRAELEGPNRRPGKRPPRRIRKPWR
jgi:hypothetical protein